MQALPPSRWRPGPVAATGRPSRGENAGAVPPSPDFRWAFPRPATRTVPAPLHPPRAGATPAPMSTATDPSDAFNLASHVLWANGAPDDKIALAVLSATGADRKSVV